VDPEFYRVARAGNTAVSESIFGARKAAEQDTVFRPEEHTVDVGVAYYMKCGLGLGSV
jgi:hypothetical protein